MTATRMEQVMDRLERAWAGAGLSPLAGPADDVEQVLSRIASVIAPWRLPAELLAFWRRLEPEQLGVLGPHPGLTSLEFALTCWQDHEREDRPTPTLLFPIAYQSHCFTYLELDDATGHGGGAVFYWCYTDSQFVLTHTSLSSYLDQWVSMIASGHFDRHELDDGRQYYEFDPQQRWGQMAQEYLPLSVDLPPYGHDRLIPSSIPQWPEHWLQASGLGQQVRRPRGADTTIAALLAAALAGGQARGTVHARIQYRHGSSSSGTTITIDDGTDQVGVWCPSSTRNFLYVSTTTEFDLVLEPLSTAGGFGTSSLADIRPRLSANARRMGVGLCVLIPDRPNILATATAIRALSE